MPQLSPLPPPPDPSATADRHTVSLALALAQPEPLVGWVTWENIEPAFEPVTDPARMLSDYSRLLRNGGRHPLCLFDSAAPGPCPFETARRTRQLDPDITIVLLSDHGRVHQDDLDLAVAEGILVVAKPFDPDLLRSNLKVLVSEWHRKHRAAPMGHPSDRTDYLALINSIDMLLFVLDMDGTVIDTNETTVRKLGYGKSEMVGRSAAEFHPPTHRAAAARNLAAMANGSIDSCNLPLITKAGDWLEVEIRVARGQWEGRNVLLGTCKDVTELQASRNRFKLLFQQAGLAMAVARAADGMILDVNLEFEDRLGYPTSDTIGRTLTELGLFENAAEYSAILCSIGKGTPVRQRQVALRTRDGRTRVAVVCATTVTMAEGVCTVFTMLDITEQHEATSKLAANLTALDASAEGIAITDSAGIFIYMNPAHAALFGYSDPAELLGKSWRSLYRPAEIERIETEVFPILDDQGYWRGRLPGRKKNDTTVFQEVRLTLTESKGIVCFTNDVTEIVQGLRQRESLLALTKSLWLICDFEGRTVQFNDVWLDVLALDSDEFSQQSFVDHLHPEDAAATRRALRSLADGVAQANFSNRLVDGSGKVHWLDWCAIGSVPDGLVYATAHDITQTKMAEQSVIDNIASMKNLGEMKANFLAMASHELRTPLANIALGTGLLRGWEARLAAPERQRILTSVTNGVDHMTRLVENLLVSSKLQQPQLAVTPEVSNLQHLLDAAISHLPDPDRPRIRRRFVSEIPLATLDKSLFQHIAHNLLSNACKYSPADTPVELEVAATDGAISVSVRDSGIGLPPDQIERVFDGFFRGRNVGSVSGTGLGLFIVRQCVELLGGRIGCRNRPTGGAEFEVTVPLPDTHLSDMPGAPPEGSTTAAAAAQS